MKWPGMRSEYAWLPPHRWETVTRAGRVGVAFSAHRAGELVRGRQVAAGVLRGWHRRRDRVLADPLA